MIASKKSEEQYKAIHKGGLRNWDLACVFIIYDINFGKGALNGIHTFSYKFDILRTLIEIKHDSIRLMSSPINFVYPI